MRDDSAAKKSNCFSREPGVQYPASTWKFTTVGNSSFRESNSLTQTSMQANTNAHKMNQAAGLANPSRESVGKQTEEEAVAHFCTHCQHLHMDQGKALSFAWVWGVRIIDMAALMSATHIRSGPHLRPTCLFSFPSLLSGHILSL